MRKQTSTTGEIILSIVKLIDKTNRNDHIYFEINNELSDFSNDKVQYKRPVQQVSENDTVGKTSIDGKQRQHTAGDDRQVSKKSQFLSG